MANVRVLNKKILVALFTAYLCIIRPVVVLHAKAEKREDRLIIYLGRELIRSPPQN